MGWLKKAVERILKDKVIQGTGTAKIRLENTHIINICEL